MTRRKIEFSPKGLNALMMDFRYSFEGAPDGHPREEDLFGYATGALLPARRRSIHQHLDTCPTCTFRLDEFESAAQAWDGPHGSERLQMLRERLRFGTQGEFEFTDDNGSARELKLDGSYSAQRELPTGERIDSQENVYAILMEAEAIERGYDYVLPSGLHSDTHINVGKVCRSERLLGRLVSVFDKALAGVAFDTVVSTGWTMATVARRLIVRRRMARRQHIRHLIVEGYASPTLLGDVQAGARAVLFLDVAVTGNLGVRLTEDLRNQQATVVKTISVVDARLPLSEATLALDGLCKVSMDIADPGRCLRCNQLEAMEFNPIAYRMTKKKAKPRSPSEFLMEDSTARELWELVDGAGAYEHHRVIGKRHYVGFVDTIRLLKHAKTAPPMLKKLGQRIVERSGTPEVVLVPARARSRLFAESLLATFDQIFGIRGVQLAIARRRSGSLMLAEMAALRGRRVLVADVASGQGDTLDELTLLAAQAGASTVAGAVLLSRLSEACEDALDARLGGGFTRLYSMPVRPITVHGKAKQQCPVCRRRQELREAIHELPRGPVQEMAKELLSAPRFRRRIEPSKATSRVTGPRQIGLFPLGRCRRGVASGIALHALHAAMGDGMAPLSLPEIADGGIPSVNRAAIVQDLPESALKWSGKPLLDQLRSFLELGGDKLVWIAIADLLSRAGSTVWFEALGRAIPQASQRGGWMDERFWAWMICSAYRFVHERPEAREQMRVRLEDLAMDHKGTPVSRGLEGMLATVSGR